MHWWSVSSSCFNLLPWAILLFTIDLSSALILYLITLAEWSRPIFIVVALVALFFAYLRIWYPATAYKSGQIFAIPQVKMTYKVYFLAVAMLVVVAHASVRCFRDTLNGITRDAMRNYKSKLNIRSWRKESFRNFLFGNLFAKIRERKESRYYIDRGVDQFQTRCIPLALHYDPLAPLSRLPSSASMVVFNA